MMEMQYSVSPRLKLKSLGPKPSENVSTRTPCHRATRKCPNSCTNTSTPRTNKKGKIENMKTSGASPDAWERVERSGLRRNHGLVQATIDPAADDIPSIRAGPVVQRPD